ncbi:aminoglycoside phosphotransferase family protein [Streptomyces sp. NPDC057638]|uniref:aminoglycoside phosphotransferase family protein n=1 Tax=Streptomyces sp. NPDC057638 TaxID=3346190 RepID=UPI0036B3D5BB
MAGVIEIPEEFTDVQRRYGGEAGRAFLAELPRRAERFLRRWELRPAGAPMHGWGALVLPVVRADGTRAALKLQRIDDENAGEGDGLRAWDGDGAARLLARDEETNTLLLEWLDGGRSLNDVPGVREALPVLAGLMARLTARTAPPGLRRLGDLTARLLTAAPTVIATHPDADERGLLKDCAAAVREVADESGDALLHWDLHYGNVLAAGREPWLAIDPKPLAGDPGFELFPALMNRFDPAGTDWRFDLMTEVLALDRDRARAWTLARILQNGLWHIADEEPLWKEEVSIARTLLAR